jgi:hypothetical protein
MDKNRRKELQEQYKEVKTYMGIFQIKNNVNGKVFIDSSRNLKNQWLTIKWQLDAGRFANSQLQKDWKDFGEEAFTYEVLEEKETDKIEDIRWELKQMEKQWLEKIQPYEDRGYSKLSNK